MTRNTKILTTATGIATATMIGFFAYVAQGGTIEPASARGRIAERLAQLGVTDAQRTEVKTILRKYQPTVGPMVQQLVEARRGLRDTIRTGTNQ